MKPSPKFWLIVAIFLIGIGTAGGLKAADLELLKAGELSVATEGTYPPFSMVDDKGKLYGLEIGVVQEIAKRIGLKYSPVMIKWESLLVGLFADQFDMISAAMDITPERQQKVTFSDGWLESGGKLVVQTNSEIKKISDIKGKTVGCLVASTWAEIAKGLGAKDVKFYKAESDALQDLVNKNIDGVVTDAIAAAYAIKTSKLPLRLCDEYLSRIQKGLAFKTGKPNLVKAVNSALSAMVKDGTYGKITKEIIGFDPHPEKPIPSNVK